MLENEQFPEDPIDTNHKKTISKTMIGSIVGILILAIVAFVLFKFLTQDSTPSSYKVSSSTSTKFITPKVELITPKYQINNKLVLTKLNEILLSVKNSMKNTTKNTATVDSLKTIEKSTLAIQKSINDLSKSKQDITKLERLINSSNIKLKEYIKELNTKVAPGNKIFSNPFELVSIDIWNNKPQATIQINSKQSIVDINDVRMGWKILNIDFDKEQVSIFKNSKTLILNRLR